MVRVSQIPVAELNLQWLPRVLILVSQAALAAAATSAVDIPVQALAVGVQVFPPLQEQLPPPVAVQIEPEAIAAAPKHWCSRRGTQRAGVPAGMDS